jgi:Flp pilus assembly protein TadB
MKMLAQGRHPHELLAALRPDPRTADIVNVFPLLGNSGSIGWPLLSMAACAALALALLRALTALPSSFAAMLAGALGVGLPVLYLVLCRAKRRSRFEERSRRSPARS